MKNEPRACNSRFKPPLVESGLNMFQLKVAFEAKTLRFLEKCKTLMVVTPFPLDQTPFQKSVQTRWVNAQPYLNQSSSLSSQYSQAFLNFKIVTALSAGDTPGNPERARQLF
jgi:hypothetical protein